MAILTKEAIFTTDDLPHEVVDLHPFWPGEVHVWTLGGDERDEIELMMLSARNGHAGPGMQHVRATLAAYTMRDETGKRLFSNDDIPALGKKSGAALDRVVGIASRLNRLRKVDLDELSGN